MYDHFSSDRSRALNTPPSPQINKCFKNNLAASLPYKLDSYAVFVKIPGAPRSLENNQNTVV